VAAARTFEELLAEGEAEPVEGWDFSWFDGRATEERPSWGYSRLLAERMAGATAALDIQTGGGEVLAQIPHPPPTLAATESWPPNIEVARRNLGPLGASVTEVDDLADLPFPAESFDLVVSRHPTDVRWEEIARSCLDDLIAAAASSPMVLLRLRQLLLRLQAAALPTGNAVVGTRRAWVQDLLARNFPVIAAELTPNQQ